MAKITAYDSLGAGLYMSGGAYSAIFRGSLTVSVQISGPPLTTYFNDSSIKTEMPWALNGFDLSLTSINIYTALSSTNSSMALAIAVQGFQFSTKVTAGSQVKSAVANLSADFIRGIWGAYDPSQSDLIRGNGFADRIDGAGGDDQIWGLSGADVLIGAAGNDTLFGGSGNDNLTGGTGNDTFNVDAGTDSITDLTSTDRLIVSAGATAMATGVLKFSGYNVANNGTVSIAGSAGADSIVGTAGVDVIAGAAGNDKLAGGTGNDRFVFDTTLSSNNIDTVTDFVKGVDKLILDDDIFAKLGIGTTTGKLISSGNYKIGSAAGDANDYLIYNPTTDKLYYDTDGNGAHAAMQIATIPLSGTSAPAYSDFLLVA